MRHPVRPRCLPPSFGCLPESEPLTEAMAQRAALRCLAVCSAYCTGQPEVKAYGGTVAPVAGVTPVASSAHRAHRTTASYWPMSSLPVIATIGRRSGNGPPVVACCVDLLRIQRVAPQHRPGFRAPPHVAESHHQRRRTPAWMTRLRTGVRTRASAHQGLSEARVDMSDSSKKAQLGETDRRGPRPSPNVHLTVF